MTARKAGIARSARGSAPRQARRPYDEATVFDWDTFVARWWNRRAVVFRGAGVTPFTAADVFTAAVGAREVALRETYDAAARRHPQFSVDGQVQAFLARWLPLAEDRDLAGYAARLAGALAGRSHALMISSFHSYSFAVWSSARAWFAPLWQRIGLPVTGAITTLFHGDYEATPSGVHKDRFTTFLFALAGKKRMRFWPERPWREPVSTLTRYEAHLASSFTIDVAPGDILYWPSSYYHVGENLGGLATSVNIGIPIDGHRAAYYVDDLVSSLDGIDACEAAQRQRPVHAARRRPLVRGALSAGGRLSATLPAALTSALAELAELTAPSALASRSQRVWLARRSAGAFEPPPPPARRVRLADRDRVRGDRAFPVVCAETRGERGGWECAANGHVLPAIDHPGVPALCAALASGRVHTVGALARSAAPVRALLEQLVALRAVALLGEDQVREHADRGDQDRDQHDDKPARAAGRARGLRVLLAK